MKEVVMVIDDSRAMRTILAGQLEDMGFETIEACDGKNALEVLASRPDMPVLALVDWNMPVMNGLEFIGAVRANDRLRPLKLLVVTSEAEVGHMMEALAAGADEYLMKPFAGEALRSKMSLLGLDG